MAGIYIHVPFCAKKCLYCDFFSKTDMSQKSRYIDSLLKEIDDNKDFISGERIDTLYFGGGTPSQLEEDDFRIIFDKLNESFDLSFCSEITIEVNPDDIDKDYLIMLRRFPFNRMSMGIQSFNDKDLKFLNRRHNSEEAVKAVKLAQIYGFKNISIDLIYGLPEQTIELWKKNISKAVSLDVTHISAYHLIYEEGTPLFRLLEAGKIKEVGEETSLDMFRLLISELESNGFRQYEISNFCRPGYHSRHNSSYWSGDPYLGLGPGAHSYNGKIRQCNRPDLKSYISGKGYREKEILSDNDVFNDYILTSVRVMEGMNLSELEKRFGQEKKAYTMNMAKKYIDNGTLEIKDGFLRLTKEGVFISDAIMSDMMYVED